MELQVNVADKTYDLGEHVVALAQAIKVAAVDGFKVADLLPLGQAALADLAPAFSDASGALAEAKSDLKSFLSAIALSSLDLGFSFKSAKGAEQDDHKPVGSWVSIVSFLISAAPQLVSLAQQLIALLKSKSVAERESIKEDVAKACESGDVSKVEDCIKGHLQQKEPEKVEAPAAEKSK